MQTFGPIFTNFQSLFDDFDYFQDGFLHFKPDIKVEEWHPIDTFRIIVIAGTGILGKHRFQDFDGISGNLGCQRLRQFNTNPLLASG